MSGKIEHENKLREQIEKKLERKLNNSLRKKYNNSLSRKTTHKLKYKIRSYISKPTHINTSESTLQEN